MAGFVVEELQADEIRSFVGGKTRPTWIFVAIGVLRTQAFIEWETVTCAS